MSVVTGPLSCDRCGGSGVMGYAHNPYPCDGCSRSVELSGMQLASVVCERMKASLGLRSVPLDDYTKAIGKLDRRIKEMDDESISDGGAE